MTGENVNNQIPEGNDHPSAQRVAAYLGGANSVEERLSIERHFIHCAECRGRMAMIRQARQPDGDPEQSPEFANLLRLGEQAAQRAWQGRKAFAEAASQATPRGAQARRQWWESWALALADESQSAGFFGSRGALALATALLLSFGLMSLFAWQLWQEREEKQQAQRLAAEYDVSRQELAQRLGQLEQSGGEQFKQEREKRVAAEALIEDLKTRINASQSAQQNIPVYARRLSAEKGTGDELSLSVPANAQTFILTLLKSKPYEFPEYAIEIVDQRGRKVSELTGIRPVGDEGTLNLTLNRATFEASKYQLWLFGQRGKARQKIGQYELAVSYAR